MNLITLENINKSFGPRPILIDASLIINEGEKLGLIGINGTGKSTLLKIIEGSMTIDSGSITKSTNLAPCYLPQWADFNDNVTVLQQIFMGENPLLKTAWSYEDALSKLESEPQNEKYQKLVADISLKMDEINGWELESKAKTILTKLGITNFNQKVKELSGGQKKRIALAEALISPGNLLLLDEPTNHLDSSAIEWLEQYLISYSGAILMITHDRYFLDRVTGRILELSYGKLYSYNGNYSVFLEAKIQRDLLEQSMEEKRENLLKRELAWIKRGAKARTTKQKARIKRFEALSSEEYDTTSEKIEINIESERLGKKVIELSNISKSYEGKKLINNFSHIFKNGDKVGILGENGSGKTTLLNIILGNIKADEGNIEIGSTVKIGYFSQTSEVMNENQRVIDYIKEEGDPVSASKLLEKFLFSGEMQYSFIGKLSGGEKRRLQLLKVLTASPNVIFLDEPTNDIDVETLTILEDYLLDYKGTIIAVSHDRYFLDKLCDYLIVFNKDGVLASTHLSCSDYLDEELSNLKIKDKEDSSASSSKNASGKNDNKTQQFKNSHEDVPRFTFKEKKEYDEIETLIEGQEEKVSAVNKNIENSSSDYEALQKYMEEKQIIEEKLLYLMERWEYLSELKAKIDAYNESK